MPNNVPTDETLQELGHNLVILHERYFMHLARNHGYEKSLELAQSFTSFIEWLLADMPD